jgi:hypothetical protein
MEKDSESVTISWESGLYAGEVLDGVPHGLGTWTHSDRDTYTGEFKNGDFNGHGTYKFVGGEHSGDVYIGEFKDDKKHGHGTYTFGSGEHSGDVFVGEFKDDNFGTHGTYTYGSGEHSGDVYVGEVKDGQFHGQGTYTFAHGDEIVGEFKENKAHGHGTYTFADGQTYVGELKNNKEDGYGTWTHPDGDSYVGDHKDGKMYGSGTWTTQHGEKQVGEFRNFDFWEGTEFDKDGKVTATYSDGERKLRLFDRLLVWSIGGFTGILAFIVIVNFVGWSFTIASVFCGAGFLLFSFIFMLPAIRKKRSRWDQIDQIRSKPMEGQNSSLPTLPLSATTPETDDGRIPW